MPDIRITVARQNLRDARVEPDDALPLAPGQARLAIDQFALTANNITYAAFGDAMRYWDFFPCQAADRGCIPVWGHATVTASTCDGVNVGERFYGFWPMATALTVEPARVSSSGFTDGASHRQGLAAVYNQYQRVPAATSPIAPAALDHAEALTALLRPLFTTAFLIDDFLDEARSFGATTVLMSSASSKTAAATAFCLARRRGQAGAARVVGLTSATNLTHTAALGVYDNVLPYDALVAADDGASAVYVDFSGSAALRRSVHTHWADRLAHSAAIGGTHWEDLSGAGPLPGPRPTLFFAPAQVKQRLADWGAPAFGQRVDAAWAEFLRTVDGPAQPWIQVQRLAGTPAVIAALADQLDGRVPASVGQVMSLRTAA